MIERIGQDFLTQLYEQYTSLRHNLGTLKTIAINSDNGLSTVYIKGMKFLYQNPFIKPHNIFAQKKSKTLGC